MGCGFSSALSSKKSGNGKHAKEENQDDNLDNEAYSKTGDRRESLSENREGNGELKTAFKSFHNRIAEGGCIQSLGAATSSQVNFFRMLDEKIENGIEFDPVAHEEQCRKIFLQSVEEWDHVVGKNMESSIETDSSIVPSSNPKKPYSASSAENAVIHQPPKAAPPHRLSSVDSTGTQPNSDDNESPTGDGVASSLNGSAILSQRPQTAIGERITSDTRPNSRPLPSSAKSVTSSDDLSHSNRSIRLKNVLQDA